MGCGLSMPTSITELRVSRTKVSQRKKGRLLCGQIHRWESPGPQTQDFLSYEKTKHVGEKLHQTPRPSLLLELLC